MECGLLFFGGDEVDDAIADDAVCCGGREVDFRDGRFDEGGVAGVDL